MTKKHKKTTSQDIATAAGVSQSTVSMILNGRNVKSFSSDTVQRVLEAADQLGYRTTRSGKKENDTTKQILLVCPVLSNPYYTTVIQAIEQAAYDKGYITTVCTTYRNAEIELRHLSIAEKSNLAGIIFTAIPFHIQIVEGISRRVPVVVIGDRNDMIHVDAVEVSSYHSGVAVAKHLMELGHRNVAFLSTSLNSQNTIRQKRMEGVRDALQASGHPHQFLIKSQDTSSVEENMDFAIEHKVGWQLAMECIEQKKFTALVAVNDMVAYGALDALRSKGHQIPQEYSVCGFDNIFPSHMSGVGLTSVENFMVQKGQDALDLLLTRIQQKAGHTEERQDSINRVEYQPRLIIRSTTGPVRDETVRRQRPGRA